MVLGDRIQTGLTMSLTTQVFQLKPHEVKEACGVMLDASIAMENGGKWREIFRQAKHKHAAGRLRRIYALLEKAEPNDIEQMAASLAEVRL